MSKLAQHGLAVAAVVVLLLTAACGGGDPATKKTPETSPTGGSTKAADTDVCDLVTPATLAKVIPNVPTTKLAYGMENFATCGVTGTVTFEFGFRISEGGETMPKPGGEYTTAVTGLGDSAVLDDNKYSARLWAEKDGVTYYVRNETVANPKSAISLDQTKQVMKELLAEATPTVVGSTPAIELGPLCLPADSPLVTDLVGEVVTARGGSEATKGSPECQYLGKGGTRIDLNPLAQDGAAKDFLVGDDKVVTMKGAQRAMVSSDTGPGSVDLKWSTNPDTVWFADVDPLTDFSDYQNKNGKATLAGVEALGRGFMKLNPDIGT